MSKLRCYIKPFDDSGNYLEWIEVTDDVDFNKMGSLNEKLEGSEYDVGVFTFSSVSLKLNNSQSTYSDIEDIKSMFRWRRSGSKVKVTWQKGDDDAVCNFATCGESYPYYELPILEGLLSDESLTSDLQKADVSFKILSYASVFSGIETPFTSLSDGDTVSEILAILFAESEVLKTVNIGIINPNYNAVVDVVEGYEDTDISEVIAELLLISNSVLYFEGDIINIGARTPTSEVQQTFYGQASRLGIENIIKLSTIRSGLNRTFNLWRWDDTSVISKDSSSVTDRGARIKGFDISAITNNTTRQAILDTYKNEFANPRREFDITTDLDTDNRILLDKINIDYPTPYYTREDETLPRFALTKFGESKFPFGEYGIILTILEYFKVIGVRIDLKKDLITYKVREI